MEQTQFIEKVRSCKMSMIQTGSGAMKTFPAKVNPERTRWKLTCEIGRKQFRSVEKKTVIVEFFKKQNLSVFQAEMMLMVFGCGTKPMDYAAYDKCPAGVEFIANIKSIATEDVIDLLGELKALQEKKLEILGKIKGMAGAE